MTTADVEPSVLDPNPEQRAAAFNDAHPVGTPVIFYPGVREPGLGRISTTRSRAWVVGDEPIVSVDGYAGGIALSHVDVLTATRSDDKVLQQLALCIEPAAGQRLLELVHADSRAQQLLDAEHRAQRAEDLAEECRRQLTVARRQADRVRLVDEVLADVRRYCHLTTNSMSVERQGMAEDIAQILTRAEVKSDG